MPITISKPSIEKIEAIIENTFNNIEDEIWNDEEYYNLIIATFEFGLYDKAESLIIRLPHNYLKVEVKKRIKELTLKAA